MVKLVDLNPVWVDTAERKGLGVIFDCILGHCCGRLQILFSNPLDGRFGRQAPQWRG